MGTACLCLLAGLLLRSVEEKTMKTELVINVSEKKVETALVEGGKLVEFRQELINEPRLEGIFLARVKVLQPNLRAAYVNIGSGDKGAFLQYSKLDSKLESQQALIDYIQKHKTLPDLSKIKVSDIDIPRDGAIETYIRPEQWLLVQIEKEAINTKGQVITTDISIAGRTLVLRPFTSQVNVSSSIHNSAEKSRLRNLISSLLPQGFGVIVRTEAEGKGARYLEAELKDLLDRWERAMGKLSKLLTASQPKPGEIYKGQDLPALYLREHFQLDSPWAIYVNDQEIHARIESYLGRIAPDSDVTVELYQDPKRDIFKAKGVGNIKDKLSRIVNIEQGRGAYLVLDQTEAMYVIDVNSGSRRKKNDDDKGDNAGNRPLEVNLLAAEEVARQIRLRDIGGIIAIDFIDMSRQEDRNEVNRKMAELLKEDKNDVKIQPISKIGGVMLITHPRVRAAINSESKGEVRDPQVSEIVKDIEHYVRACFKHPMLSYLNIHTHPFLAAYLDRGIWKLSTKALLKGKRLVITPNEELSAFEYVGYDKAGKTIHLHELKDY